MGLSRYIVCSALTLQYKDHHFPPGPCVIRELDMKVLVFAVIALGA